VTIRRHVDTAVIEFADGERIVNFVLDCLVDELSDKEIINRYNACIISTFESAADWQPVEIVEGRPQIKYDLRYGGFWSAEGQVLRCVIERNDDYPLEPVVRIDQHKLSWSEFGQLVSSYCDWGMRIFLFRKTSSPSLLSPSYARHPRESRKRSSMSYLARKTREWPGGSN
jgi:hypothetical protein